MTLTRFFLAPLMVALTALPAMAEKLPLTELSRYINELTTLEAEFTQINADETISTGQILINRPGRARFEYDPPEQTLVIAGGQQLAVFDGKSNTGPEQYPLKETPLNLILARDVDLDRSGMVVAHDYDGTATVVTAQDPENPQYGNIQLMFTADPIELRQWVITDGSGSQTTVILGALETGMRFNTATFSITAEIESRNR
ncbi:outer membrane lipoprotein carrier protein LolA [Maritimibacter sp. HL-12]|uniref:LolA family protein n=1 Tax=Maritimibacter sp. HL-12 TaxID=1162418 RepID=UPI000A0F1415|nr:outer membrane lipoprotein carrier protein LolA [Maritimibacter sp. HL-12]SMH43487.1 Outer membrane lipoprotein-sorting protein [Maritimibacter sp. HL-12]